MASAIYGSKKKTYVFLAMHEVYSVLSVEIVWCLFRSERMVSQ